MAKDWAALGGDKGKKVDTSRVGRALKLGKVAAQFTGSMLKAGLTRKRDENFEAMAEAAVAQASKIADVMGEMKGAAMKVGQMLSADPDLVDPAFAEKLITLQREAPPMDFETVRAQIEKWLDRPMDAVFSYFDPEPLGAASIGQVHRATLFDGREVAVKVQYPGIAESITSDLKNLGSMLKVGRVFVAKERADAFIAEARDVIIAEADYRREGANLTRFRELLADFEGVRVPAPIEGLVTEQVLVMEFCAGEKLDDAINAIADAEERNAIALRFVTLFVTLFHDHHALHADPHPGNFLLAPDGAIVLLDFGCVRDFEPRVADDILRMLVAFWDDDMPRLEALYKRLGFGRPGMEWPDHETLRAYHRMILEPIAEDAPFRFAEFRVAGRVRSFFRENLSFLRVVPPAELLLYLRVMAGIKGMMTRIDAAVNLRACAEAACRRRGVLV